MLGNDIACEKLAFMFPFSGYGVVENLAFEGFRDLFHFRACGLHDVVHLHLAVEIEAACQRLERRQRYIGVYLLECHRLTHDVGLEDVVADLHFNGIYLHAQTVLHDKLPVVVLVEAPPLGDKCVIQGVQPFTQGCLFLFFLPLFR